MANAEITDEEAIEKILQSDNLRKLLKSLVKDEIKARGNEGNTLQKLSDMLHQVNSSNNVSSELTKQSCGPIIAINDLRGEDGVGYSQEERKLRCQLASLYRLMDLHGWTLNIYNHITLRSNGETDEFLINPLGLLYREITASSLVKINLDGKTLDPGSSVFGINKAGWSLHAALHSSRHDITCIIHTHVPDVIAVSCLKYGLLPISPEAVDLLDESPESLSRGVRYHDYWGLAVSSDEWPSLKEDLGPHSKVLFLRNHGVAVCGTNCIEAWILLKRVIQACENQIRLLQTKGEDDLLGMDMKQVKAMNGNGHTTNEEGGQLEHQTSTEEGEEENSLKMHRITSAELEFEAMMRMLDNAGYQTGYSYCHGNLLRKGCGVVPQGAGVLPGSGGPHQMVGAGDSTLANVTELSMENGAGGTNSMTTGPTLSGDSFGNTTKLTNQAIASKQKAAQRNQWLIKTMSPEQSN